MIVGIDLGTTNSLIGAMDAGFPLLFADESGSRLTPSVVSYTPQGLAAVGRDALGGVHSIKRLMGRRVGEIETDLEVVGSKGEAVKVEIAGRTYSPEEVSAEILKKLKVDAERVLGESVGRAVITVPAYFNDAQRAATKRAGELAGFTVERLVAEPTAAALAYGLERLGEKSKVAVFDLGGGTFDISVLELSGGVFHVLSTNGDTALGGDDMDAAIAERLGVSREEAERLKRDGGPEIDAACRPVVERTRVHCLRSLHDAGLKPQDLNEVILVGGATRMPLVRAFVKEVFGREPNASQHPDEAVALGAAIQAGILDGAVSNVTLLDVTPLSLGIETFGGLMSVLIPRNTTIPCKAGEMFTNAAAGQMQMKISVLQGEREMARDNWKLGEFDLEFTPAPRGQARVGVQFEIDASGILHVLARDVATGRDVVVDIRSAVEVSDDAVEKMLEDSLEHAFEDVEQRQFTEAEIKADEILAAVAQAMGQFRDSMSAEEIAQIEGLSAEVKSAREARSLQRLKKSLAELDDATQVLATRLIESLMG
jgi:molecular chaperone DnaK